VSLSVERTVVSHLWRAAIPTVVRCRRLPATLQAFVRLEAATPHFVVIVVLNGGDTSSEPAPGHGEPFPASVLARFHSGARPRPQPGRTASVVLAPLWGHHRLWDLDCRWSYVLGSLTPKSSHRFPANG
jgi:hypothetical protein